MTSVQPDDPCDSIPTSLYLHIPFCKSKCSYCSFYSEPLTAHNTSSLISAMMKELQNYPPDLPISTIYIGGGTPTCIGHQLCTLIEALKRHFTFAGAASEFTIEANPTSLDSDLLSSLFSLGVNRLSIGSQSFNQSELTLLGRTHTPDDIPAAVDMARAAGFTNIALDLIFAIPGSSLDTLTHSLRSAVDLAPTHISAYSLTYEPNTPLDIARQKGTITAVDEDMDRQMYDHIIATLIAAGYGQYEISNFARPSFQCAHNQTYWANKPYIGIGPAASSWFDGRRTTNVPSIEKYTAAINESRSPIAQSCSPTDIEIACETAVLNLRQLTGINIAQYKTQTGHDIFDLFKNEIKQNQKQGLLTVTPNTIALTKKALPIADRILSDFSTL